MNSSDDNQKRRTYSSIFPSPISIPRPQNEQSGHHRRPSLFGPLTSTSPVSGFGFGGSSVTAPPPAASLPTSYGDTGIPRFQGTSAYSSGIFGRSGGLSRSSSYNLPNYQPKNVPIVDPRASTHGTPAPCLGRRFSISEGFPGWSPFRRQTEPESYDSIQEGPPHQTGSSLYEPFPVHGQGGVFGRYRDERQSSMAPSAYDAAEPQNPYPSGYDGPPRSTVSALKDDDNRSFRPDSPMAGLILRGQFLD